MITIDRESSTPVNEQVADQMRFAIASGHFAVGSALPSTRDLAGQLGISFHTVRKAYIRLQKEGLVTAKGGSAYLVIDRLPTSKSDRMERGAGIIRSALQQLMSLGFKEDDIEYLVGEQLALIDQARPGRKVVFVGPFPELAESAAEQIAHALQSAVEPVEMRLLQRHQDTDIVIALFQQLTSVMEVLPKVDAIGIDVTPDQQVLEKVARLLPSETLGIITRDQEAIEPVMSDLQYRTGYEGQMIATSISPGSPDLDRVVSAADLVLYTPQTRRKVAHFLDASTRSGALEWRVTRESLDRLRREVAIW